MERLLRATSAPTATTSALTVTLINISSVVSAMEEQVLPALYLFLGASLGATPFMLGLLTLARALTQALSSPIAGLLGDQFDRALVVSFGCGMWATMTFLMGCSTSVWATAACCAVNGVGLAMVIPSLQSLLADSCASNSRGRAFGTMQTVSALGGMAGGLMATNIGGTSPFGVEGWRVALFIVAGAGATCSVLVAHLAVDPQAGRKFADRGKHVTLAEAAAAYLHTLATDLGEVVRIPTFQIIIGQGIVGSFPWVALTFLTLFLQLLGFSDLHASLLTATFGVGCAGGASLGGFLGDMAAQAHPNHGRTCVSQFSVFWGLPLSWVLLRGLPDSGQPGHPDFNSYAALLLGMGLVISWSFASCNSPIFAEIVPEEKRCTTYAFDRSFEGAVAACAAPVVGLLAKHVYGFTGAVSEGSPEEQLANARALGNSLMWCLILPWTLCLLIYSGLHWTYPPDRQRIERERMAP